MEHKHLLEIMCALHAMQEEIQRTHLLIECAITNKEFIDPISSYPFEDFWESWRYHGGKKLDLARCEKLYSRIDEKTRELIFQALINQKEERRLMKKNRARFIPDVKHPGTWLSKKSWLNEISTEQEIINEIDSERAIAANSRTQQAVDACWDDD